VKVDTLLVHSDRVNNDFYRSLRFPIYESVAFEFESSKDMENAFMGRSPSYFYSRISNPTISELERIVSSVTGAYGVVATSSGMSAISNVIMTIAGSGANIITSPFLFGNTYSLFEKTLKNFGLNVKYVDFSDVNEVEKAIDEKTVAIFFEVITNPQLAVFDIENICKIAKKYNLLTIADDTLPTFLLFSSKDWGVDIEVISSTKALSGGATSVGGLIIDYGTYDWSNNKFLKDYYDKYGRGAFIMRLKREVYRNLGACISPFTAYLNILGIETLSLRINKICDNAFNLANMLIEHPKVKSVNYPGLVSSKYYINAKKYLRKYGPVLTIELDSKESCFRFIDNLKLIRRATNIYDNKTLVIHPSSTIFSEYTENKKLELGVSDNMIRFSIGIEDVEDLYQDIIHALEEV